MDEATLTYCEKLQSEIRWLRGSVLLLGIALVASVLWLGARSPNLPPVLSAERLEIREPDGNLAFVLANSVRPAVATIDGQVLMEGQEEERRGVPSFIFFDGKGDEVGGILAGARTSPEGFSAVRHLSLDGYKQDQTVVLAHYQSPEGSMAGLRVSDRPEDLTFFDVLDELGLEPGASREELEGAIQAMQEEGRADRLDGLFGAQRLFLGSDRERNATLVLRDGLSRPRIRITVPEEGAPSIQVLDETGETLLTLP